MTAREQFIQGLLDAADFFAKNPDIDTPSSLTINQWLSSRDEMAKYARVKGGWKKEYWDTNFALRREFSGGVVFDVNISRNEVCRQVVVGKKTVAAEPAKLIPASPEREIDVTEWVCDDASLLGSKPAAEAETPDFEPNF